MSVRRVGFMLEQFPALSETFVLQQVTGLIDQGLDVRVFANYPGRLDVQHGPVASYKLAERTTYMSIPSASGVREESVFPLWQQTWIDEEQKFRRNAGRILAAVPMLARSLLRAPRATMDVLDSRAYGYHANSLSSLYRLNSVAALGCHMDVAHSHFGPVGRAFQFVRKLWHSPHVVTFHGFDFSSWPRKFGASAYTGLFASADLVTIHSDFGRSRLVALGCPAEKIRIHPCGVDLDVFRRLRQPGSENGAGPVVVLTVGRMVEKKGILEAVEAIDIARRSAPNLVYEVIGDGPLRDNIRTAIADRGLSDHVILHGARDTDFVRERMQAADIFLLPSQTAADGDEEGTPVSLLEAQAAGLPVISTHHAGIPEIVLDGESGLLVSERAPAEIATALTTLVSDGARRDAMGQCGQAFMARNHDIHKLNRSLCDLYAEAGERFAAGYRP